MPLLAWIADPDGAVYWCNRQWRDYTGTTLEQVRNWGWPSVLDPRVVAQTLERWRASLASAQAFEMVAPLAGADGTYRSFLTRIAPVLQTGGEVAHWIGTHVDISAQQADEKALTQTERSYRGTFHQAAVGVAHVDLDGRWLRVNERLCLMLGYAEADLLQTTFQDITHPDDLEADLERVRALIRGDIEIYSMEKRYFRRDRSIFWANLTVSALRDESGDILNFISVVEDISTRKEAELNLRRLNEDLEAAVQSEIVAREKIQARVVQSERMQALGQLAGGIAHDFNNILQAVIGGARLIERRPNDADHVERLAKAIVEASERGASITGRLLTFARRGDLRAQAVDPQDLLRGLKEILLHTLGAGIEISIACGPNLKPLSADRSQLETALINLAANARDAMPNGGVLTLAVDADVVAGADHRAGLQPGSYIRLSVSDTGTGMTPETLARVAEPFFTTKPPGQGTGLGLAMAKGFVEQSGGGMAIESQPGKGATVHLWLRAVLAEPVATARPAPAPATPVHLPAARVLLVDDDPMVRAVLCDQLRGSGLDMVEAANGAAALDAIQSDGRPDVLVTDLSMPGMSGVELIQAVRARFPDMPIVLLTGYAGAASEDALSAVAEEGHFSLMRKPVDADLLGNQVASLLAARRARAAGPDDAGS